MDPLFFDRATASVDGNTLLGPVSWSVGAGECWAVLGPNGSGKTTLLSLAGARRQPSGGRVAVLGEFLGETPIRELWPRIGHVSHRLAEDMSPSLTVEEVVLTGRSASLVTWLEEYGQDDLSEADRLLHESGCRELAQQRFGECSLGERQRVLVARARFGVPELLLLDEPAAGIDLPGREALVAATQAACEDGSTVVLATHHLEEIPSAATHALLLSRGSVVASGVIEDVLTSAALSSCFDIELSVTQAGGRWSARSTRP